MQRRYETPLLAQDRAEALRLLKETGTLQNPCLLLVATAACGFKRTGPLVLELDMAGELQVRRRGLGRSGPAQVHLKVPS